MDNRAVDYSSRRAFGVAIASEIVGNLVGAATPQIYLYMLSLATPTSLPFLRHYDISRIGLSSPSFALSRYSSLFSDHFMLQSRHSYRTIVDLIDQAGKMVWLRVGTPELNSSM